MALSFWQKYGAQRATDHPKWGGAFLTFGCGHQDETRYDANAYADDEIVAWARRTVCKDCRATAKISSGPRPKPGTSMTMMCHGQDSRSASHGRCPGEVRVDDRIGAPAERCACWCHR